MLDLLFVASCGWGLLVFLYLVSFDPLQITFGLLALLFAPGYAVLAVLFPRSIELKLPERLILSLGLSIVVATILGFILNFSPWGIEMNSIAVSLASVVSVLSLAALGLRYRQHSLSAPRLWLAPCVSNFSTRKTLKSLTVIALGAGTFSVVGYFLYEEQVVPRQSFTEFAVLDANGSAQDYTTRNIVGQPATYRVSIVNRHQSAIEYRVEIWILERLEHVEGPFILQPAEQWEHSVTWIPSRSIQRAWLEFRLFRSNERTLVGKAGFWITVREDVRR